MKNLFNEAKSRLKSDLHVHLGACGTRPIWENVLKNTQINLSDEQLGKAVKIAAKEFLSFRQQEICEEICSGHAFTSKQLNDIKYCKNFAVHVRDNIDAWKGVADKHRGSILEHLIDKIVFRD